MTVNENEGRRNELLRRGPHMNCMTVPASEFVRAENGQAA